MSGRRLGAYRGNGEYVFASYCHKDDARVLPLLEGLADAGVHVWYDEGINPGEEWPQVIQEHIEGCAAFVAFVSAASQESHNCRKELNEALTLEKPTIPVLLEDCEKSRATQMLLARLHAMKCWEYETADQCAAELARVIAQQHPDAVEGVYGGRLGAEKQRLDAEGMTLGEGLSDAEGVGSAGGADKDGLGLGSGSVAKDFGSKSAGGRDSDNTHSPKPRKWIAAAIAATAAILLIVFLVAFQPWNPLASDGVVRIVLQPEEGVSVRDFNADIETVKNRLDRFAGEGGYSMSAGPSTMTVELSRSCLGNLEVKNALRCYITRPVNLWLAESYDAKDRTGGQPISVARSDIQNVTVEDGPVAGFEAIAAEAGLPKDYKVIKMALTDDFMEQNNQVIDSWGEDLILVQDKNFSSIFFYDPVVHDGNVLYFLDKDQLENPNIPEVIAYNYTHDALRGSIMFTVSLEDQVNWEEPGEGAFRGENQVSSRALNGKLVILRYSDSMHSNVENITEGAQIDLEMGLKMRFDALDVPYAFGYVDEGLDSGGVARYAVFKTPWDLVNSRYVHMLAASRSWDLSAFAQDCAVDLNPDTCSVSVKKSEDGVWRIVVAGKSIYGRETTPTGELAAFEKRLEAGDDVSFMLGGYVALKARYGGVNDEGFLVFDGVTTVEGQPVEEADAQRAVEFYATCLDTWQRMPSGLEFKNGEAIEDGQLSETQSMKVERLDEYDQIEQSVTKAVPGASVNLEQPSVKVQLDLPVNGNLARDGLEAARKVFKAVGYQHAEFPSITVFLVNEDRMEGNRARIELTRTTNYDDGSFKLHVIEMVEGDQLEGYAGDFESLMQADAFYSALSNGVDAEGFERVLQAGSVETSDVNGISYDSRYFELMLPSSWDGRWEVEYDHEFREALSATNYYYSFSLDGVPQFSIECKEFSLGPAEPIGSTGKRQVEFYPADALSEDDSAFIRSSMKVLQE